MFFREMMASSKCQDSSTIEVYDYQLVEFEGSSVDFVPNGWVYFDVTRGSLVTKFIPPPYNASTFKSLNILIRSKAPVEFLPVSGWPAYSIKLIGQAKNFQEAEEKLKTFHAMSRKSLAYTEDSDYTPDEKAKKIEQQYRLNRNRPEIDLLNVIPIESESDTSNSLVDTSWELKEPKALATKQRKQKDLEKNSVKPAIKKKKHSKSNKTKNKPIYSSENSSTNSDDCAKSINLPPTCINADKEASPASLIQHQSINLPQQSILKKSQNPTTSGPHSSTRKNKGKEKYKNASQDTCLILEKFVETNSEISEMKKRLSRIEVILEKLLSKNETDSKRSFIIDNNLNLPFNDIQDFLDYDSKLCTNQQFKMDFIRSLDVLMDGNFIITKSILNIMKRYFSKEVAMRFTNTKKSGDKLIMKNYDFHRCIMDAVIQTHFNQKTKTCVSEKAVLEGIGIVLANVKDWEGGRKERLKK